MVNLPVLVLALDNPSPSCDAYLDQETIDQQQHLLVAHRHTLVHLLQPAAQFGGELNEVAEARRQIRRIKATVRENSVPAAVERDDEGHDGDN